ncbi:MAG TPA: hypothetical protein VGR69_05670 [Candidatus Rubrimentiphilum sp.]|nr:hypothetical protein [Candidatus Rubrimentiphilum sp.]
MTLLMAAFFIFVSWRAQLGADGKGAEVSAQPLEIRMAHLEGAYEQISHRLNGIDQRLNSIELKMESRFAQVDSRFGQIDGRLGQIDQKFIWLFGLIGSSWITTILAVLYHR